VNIGRLSPEWYTFGVKSKPSFKAVRFWAHFAAALIALPALAVEPHVPPPVTGANAVVAQPPLAATAAGVHGKVLFEGKPAPGVLVLVYPDAGTGFKGTAVASSGPTAADGRFSLALKPGRYFLVGKQAGGSSPDAEPGPGELFGYYGGNPVKVTPDASSEANLQVIRRAPLTIAAGAGTDVKIEGVLMGPRGPEESATLFAYPDAGSDFRGPDITGPLGSVLGGTGPDGRFALELPQGIYYLTAAKRKAGTALGPLQPGDLYGYFDGNPLKLQAGQRATITVRLTEKLRQPEASSTVSQGTTGISGRIADPAGKPVAGVFAFATTDPNLIGSMPPYHSRPVGPDGVFFIEVPGGGTFYVGARTGFGGPPQPGQWQGMLGDANMHTITIEKGKLVNGVDITVRVVE